MFILDVLCVNPNRSQHKNKQINTDNTIENTGQYDGYAECK
jgi:hypothetical protein